MWSLCTLLKKDNKIRNGIELEIFMTNNFDKTWLNIRAITAYILKPFVKYDFVPIP
jgi:hypothetical protein